MPRVSFLMPVRNGAAHVDEALASMQSQTFKDLEIVVVDDGSVDETPAILHRASERDPRVRVLRIPASGIVTGLNHGIDSIDAEFIARMDADDIARPRRIAEQVAFCDAQPEIGVCGTDYVIFGERLRWARMPRGDAACRTALLLFPCFLHPSVLVRRTILERSGVRYRDDAPYAEDYQLWCDLSPHGRFANLPRALTRYRWHSGQSSIQRAEQQRKTHLRISARRFREAGAPDIDEMRIRRFLWPTTAGARIGTAAYLRESAELMRSVRRIGGTTSGWLLRTMLLRVAQNVTNRLR